MRSYFIFRANEDLGTLLIRKVTGSIGKLRTVCSEVLWNVSAMYAGFLSSNKSSIFLPSWNLFSSSKEVKPSRSINLKSIAK